MASVNQLEKLIHIQKVFASSDSLESAVAIERIESLIITTEQLLRQRAFLREERRLIRTSTNEIKSAKSSIKTLEKDDWLNSSIISTNDVSTKKIQLNVGGMLFETTHETLLKEKGSLLALLCDSMPPVSSDQDGCFHFDRDWWIFRHVLMFLRDGDLPTDHRLLAHLYREANFWRLKSLRWAIEEEKLHLRSRNVLSDEEKAQASWWKKTPSWWEKEEAKEEKPKETDWWLDEEYKGKNYSLSKMPNYPTELSTENPLR